MVWYCNYLVSVNLSITFWYCVKMAKRIVEIISLPHRLFSGN